MGKRLSGFLAGVLAAALALGIGFSALAANGTVEFNTVGLLVNGQTYARPGEDLVLDGGAAVPATILYTDDRGGGTTYLPARTVAELFGVEIGWDAASGSVTIGGMPAESAAPAASPAPVSATPSPTPVPVTVTVYVTKTGEKYHRAGCRYLSRSQIAISLSDAQGQGYTPCSVCNPPVR